MAIIPELEGKNTRKSIWSEDEIDTLKRYYSTIAEKDLIPYLNNRNAGAIRVKAHELKLSLKKVVK